MARKRTTITIRDEGGQSLVVLVFALTVIIGIAALAIDVSGWFVTRHHAQVAADAAALAAANYMAVSNGQGSTTTASTMGQTYVTKNGFDGSKATVTVNTGAATVTVTVPTTGSIFFAHALGVGPPNISATAVASYETGSTPYALFADGSCPEYGLNLQLNGNTNLNGIHSNGTLSGQFGNNTTINLNTLSMTSGCKNTLTNGNSAHAPTVSPVLNQSPLPYPVDFSSPTCTLSGGGSCYFNPSEDCTYTAGTGTPPPGVTESGGSITITGSVGSPGNFAVLCAPSGTITVAANNTTFYGTMYANQVDLNGEGIKLNPPPDQLGIYMTGPGTLDLNPGQGNGKGSNNDVLNNAYVFAPNAVVEMCGNNGSGFIEAEGISVANGKLTCNNWSFVATGPSDTNIFADTLVQ